MKFWKNLGKSEETIDNVRNGDVIILGDNAIRDIAARLVAGW
jgi:hypothetical protein